MNEKKLGVAQGPQRGDPWRCPFCGLVFPLIQLVNGTMLPVQALLTTAFTPVANLFDAKGKQVVVDPVQTIQTTRFRPTVVAIPHESICAARAKGLGQPTYPLNTSAGGPPPNCATCGHPWIVHFEHRHLGKGKVESQMAQCAAPECSCGHYVEPSGEVQSADDAN